MILTHSGFCQAPIGSEAAIKLAYHVADRSWSKEEIRIIVDSKPFSRGALRAGVFPCDVIHTVTDGVHMVYKTLTCIRTCVRFDIFSLLIIAAYHMRVVGEDENEPPKWVLKLSMDLSVSQET